MRSSTRRIRDLAVFAVLGSIMFVSQIAMMLIPNVHLLGLFIAAFTLTYRVRALIPLYVYVMVYGAFYGFSIWWLPYLYIFLPLWGTFIVVGFFDSRLPTKVKTPLYMVLCALHGLSFGVLYVPFQALMWGLNFKGMIAWILAGIPFDIIHAIGNFAAGIMIIPLTALLRKLDKSLYNI
ncbi:MAG: hypothetical protein FWH07_05545 [Oscillospiraceae bacterium]|nr:hypothetical protein [Oscillospiraceae bacterium]